MKNIIKKAGIILTVVLLIGQFTSCKKSVKETTPLAIHLENQQEKETLEVLKLRKPIVFITGIDKGENLFYINARSYFKEKNIQIIEGAYSLEEIILWMNKNATKNPFGEIHIVNKHIFGKGLSLETVVNGEKITAETLRKSIIQGEIPELHNVVTNNTKIIFHSNGLGENTALIHILKEVFMTDKVPSIVASSYYSVFGGEFSNHYLAKPYYIFYPTANSPGKVDLSKEIAKKYTEEKEIDWYNALNNETERYIGEAYTKQFLVPVKWEFDYHNSDNEIPNFTSQEEIMDWIEENEELNNEIAKIEIPLEKFRWKWSVKNSTLTIKGRTTVLCVLKPLLKPYGDLKYIEPDTNNKRLFALK